MRSGVKRSRVLGMLALAGCLAGVLLLAHYPPVISLGDDFGEDLLEEGECYGIIPGHEYHGA